MDIGIFYVIVTSHRRMKKQVGPAGPRFNFLFGAELFPLPN